jgi:hypothetical protein
MRLLVLDGSPKAPRGNTALLLDAFLRGFEGAGGTVIGRHALVRAAGREEALRRFAEADAVLLGFPLYVDAMPAPVKEFIEGLAPRVGAGRNPALLFLVQSGFPEASHSRPVERLLGKLARRLGSRDLGAIVRPGTEGIRAMPPGWSARLLRPLEALGRGLAVEGRLDAALLAQVARPERIGRDPLSRLRLAIGRHLAHRFWDQKLRAAGALAERDATPFAP